MLLAVSLALAVDQPAAEAVPAETEITVVANRLRDWRGTWRMNKGAVSCKTKRSTGDKAIDAIGCDAMVHCFGPVAQRLAALEAENLGKAETQARGKALLRAEKVTDCLAARREAGITALVAARRGNRT